MKYPIIKQQSFSQGGNGMKEKATGFVSGVVRICIQGENKERFVNLCRSPDIYIWDIRDTID